MIKILSESIISKLLIQKWKNKVFWRLALNPPDLSSLPTAAFPPCWPLSQLPLQDWHRHTLDILPPLAQPSHSPTFLFYFHFSFIHKFFTFSFHISYLRFCFYDEEDGDEDDDDGDYYVDSDGDGDDNMMMMMIYTNDRHLTFGEMLFVEHAG